jgi:predicted enzyme related to lactoylglutathione lyase
MPGPPTWVYYIRVENLERALEAVQAGGGQMLNGPMEVPGGDTVVNCMDPQGALFALHEKST